MSQETRLSQESAAAFVEGYGRTWESWDFSGFVDLFSDEVVYVAHATEETVVGRQALATYIRKEADEQGEATVRMGTPVIDGSRVAASFGSRGRTTAKTGPPSEGLSLDSHRMGGAPSFASTGST